MIDNLIGQLSSLSMVDVEAVFVENLENELFQTFETHKAAGTLEYWFNTKLSAVEKQQLIKYMEGRK